MIKNLQRFSVWQRRLIFFSIAGGILVALIAFTWILINQTLNNGARVTAVPLNAQTTVHQFAALPDDDAYPASVAVAPDGTVYTGSFATGAIWGISPSGLVKEVPGTRDAIGALMGMVVAPDGSLLVVDQLDTDPRSSGGKILRVHDGMVTPFTDTKFVSPIDVTIDAAGHVYVTDSGTNQVWRFDADGSHGAVWWTSPAQASGSTHPAATGLAYDSTRDAIIVTDPEFNTIYRVKISDGSTETLYNHGNQPDAPGFDGATVTPDGTLYVAALAQNGIVKVADGKIEYIAGMFRGPSDVAFAAPNKLYVTNFDQTSIVIPVVHPQLPFALDVVELGK
jgi:DNA-binding beta-propeller fold protein YncE